MNSTVFIAGASGAIGRRLCRLLVDGNYSVIGTTRSQAKAPMLRDLGVEPVVVDVFDAARLLDAVDVGCSAENSFPWQHVSPSGSLILRTKR